MLSQALPMDNSRDRPNKSRYPNNKYIEQIEQNESDLSELYERQRYLENKFPTLEEEFELHLLRDESTRVYSKRMAELEFKTDKTELESLELQLYKDPSTRPYAKRIIELASKQNKTNLEDIEVSLLINPNLRPYRNDCLAFAEKLMTHSLNTAEQERLAFLVLNQYSIANAKDILSLEAKALLAPDEVDRLSKNYLLRICHTPPRYSQDVDNCDDVAAGSKCITINKRQPSYNKHVTRYHAVKQQIDSVAQRLVEQSLRQIIAAQLRYSFLKTPSGVDQRIENILKTDRMQAILQARQGLVALAFEKIFFDFDVGFSKPTLDILASHISLQIAQKKVDLTTANFSDLFEKMRVSLNTIELPNETYGMAKRFNL